MVVQIFSRNRIDSDARNTLYLMKYLDESLILISLPYEIVNELRRERLPPPTHSDISQDVVAQLYTRRSIAPEEHHCGFVDNL